MPWSLAEEKTNVLDGAINSAVYTSAVNRVRDDNHGRSIAPVRAPILEPVPCGHAREEILDLLCIG